MDKDVLQQWIDRVFRPLISEHCPPGARPVLLLDSYRCHLMPSIVGAIENLGVEVVHIPGGCTGHVQPVDVGIGKPLKNRVRERWQDWLMSHADTSVLFRPPSKELLASWIVDSLSELPRNLVQNAWLSSKFSYFD
jgi:hypothetical protein